MVAFYKSLKSHNYPTARSYKNVTLSYLKNANFLSLDTRIIYTPRKKQSKIYLFRKSLE